MIPTRANTICIKDVDYDKAVALLIEAGITFESMLTSGQFYQMYSSTEYAESNEDWQDSGC